MSEPEYLKCACKECGNNIEFPPSSVRTTINCPHCNQWTELLVPEIPRAKRNVNLGSLAIVVWVLLILGLVAAGAFWLHHSKQTAKTQPEPTPLVKVTPQPNVKPAITPTNSAPQVPAKSKPKSHEDLKVGDIQLEKTKGNSLIYAVGTVKNDSDFQRFSVRIELDLISLKGSKIGTATDYLPILEPHKDWQFHAMVTEPKAVAAIVSSLNEEE